MDERLSTAAQAGNVDEFYRLIEEDGNLLRKIDEEEFGDTPLHIAAREDHIDFAMEMMNLKPSFARKLNRQGLSPIHLAVENGHKKLVFRFLEIEKDLARVRGKKGETPLHYLITKVQNCEDFLSRFMEACPECIQDVTTENQTALHIAVRNNRLGVLRVLIRMLEKTNYCQEVVNRKDKDGYTALHIAASNNQHKMLRLLLGCKADKYATNEDGSTALEVAEQYGHIQSIKILRGCFIPRVSNIKYKLTKQIVKCVAKASTKIFHDMDSISSEDRNALLVILGLLLSATFQASLSPPSSLKSASDNSSNSDSTEEDVQTTFLRFYILTCAVFIVTFFLTLALLKPYPRGFRTALQVLLAFLAMCFNESISSLAPNELASYVINIFSVLVFVLMLFMCINHRVSKISVLILGGWLFPESPVGGLIGNFRLLCWVFIFLYTNFWKGTILVLGFCFLDVMGGAGLFWPPIVLGCWFFLSLCRFSIRLCNERCPLLNF